MFLKDSILKHLFCLYPTFLLWPDFTNSLRNMAFCHGTIDFSQIYIYFVGKLRDLNITEIAIRSLPAHYLSENFRKCLYHFLRFALLRNLLRFIAVFMAQK